MKNEILSPFKGLPPEIVLIILGFLKPKDIARLLQVDRTLRAFIISFAKEIWAKALLNAKQGEMLKYLALNPQIPYQIHLTDPVPMPASKNLFVEALNYLLQKLQRSGPSDLNKTITMSLTALVKDWNDGYFRKNTGLETDLEMSPEKMLSISNGLFQNWTQWRLSAPDPNRDLLRLNWINTGRLSVIPRDYMHCYPTKRPDYLGLFPMYFSQGENTASIKILGQQNLIMGGTNLPSGEFAIISLDQTLRILDPKTLTYSHVIELNRTPVSVYSDPQNGDLYVMVQPERFFLNANNVNWGAAEICKVHRINWDPAPTAESSQPSAAPA